MEEGEECAGNESGLRKSPRPACGERHRPPSAAVSKNAEAMLRLCRIVRCDPGEGGLSASPTAETPLTPTLSPHPPSPEGGLRRTRERGEGVRESSRLTSPQA